MRHRRPVRRSSRAARLLAAGSVLLMAATAALLVSVLSSSAPDPVAALRPAAGAVEPAPSEHAGVAPAPRFGPEHRWRAVLAGLDDLRARAYADLRPRLLRRVYTPRSRVLRRDRALLLRYRQHRLRVVGLRVRVLALREDSRRDGRVVLRVRDQVTAGTLLGATVRRRLPGDAANARAITLQRSEGRWLISAVTPA
ncbi:MAG: hypothetical protein ACRDO0_07335 [Nocardioidaceae bacterium]